MRLPNVKQKVSPRGECACDPPPPEIFDLTCLLMEEHERDSPNDGYEAALYLRRVVHSGLGLE